jgi:D-serine deaminase-like pyridoxal phosphate-dependent protein
MARKPALVWASIGAALPGLAFAGVAFAGLTHAGSAFAGQAGAAPAAGRYAGSLCVASSATAASARDCGPARVDLARAGLATIRVSDIAYALTLHSSQADVVVKHGAMQIDEFTADYEWTGSATEPTLIFFDADKRVRYEVKFGRRQRAQR